MRMVAYPWDLSQLYTACPNIGCLMDLCEENYRHLKRLAPDIRSLNGDYLSRLEGTVDLHMEILEQTTYTTLIYLTHYFVQSTGRYPDPEAMIRVYHDSCQVELLDIKQKILPLKTGTQQPSLAQKWKANLFLSKRLSYCVQLGHTFHLSQDVTARSIARRNLVEPC